MKTQYVEIQVPMVETNTKLFSRAPFFRGCPHITSAAGGRGGGQANADDC